MNKLVLTLFALLLGLTVAFGQATKHKFSAKQAASIALKKYHGKIVGKIELENEEGKWQYAVNVRSGKALREVMVDAESGKIASVEVTSKKEEAAEKKAEKKGGKA